MTHVTHSFLNVLSGLAIGMAIANMIRIKKSMNIARDIKRRLASKPSKEELDKIGIELDVLGKLQYFLW